MGPGKAKEGVWTRIEPIEERAADARSERSRSRRSESDARSARISRERSSRRRPSDEEIGVAVGGDGASQDGIWQTTTITVEDEERDVDRDRRGKSWLS